MDTHRDEEKRVALVTGANKGIGKAIARGWALLDEDGPTGGFFDDQGTLPW